MTSFRATFDGRAFVPDEPVSLPPDSKVTLMMRDGNEPTQEQIDAEVRAYYMAGEDAEDLEWIKATQKDLSRLWDKD